jgi:hypothetical protein
MQAVCAFTARAIPSSDKHNKTIRSVLIVVMRAYITESGLRGLSESLAECPPPIRVRVWGSVMKEPDHRHHWPPRRQRSREPHEQAEHMAAPTSAIANSEPSTHGTSRPIDLTLRQSAKVPAADTLGCRLVHRHDSGAKGLI